MVKEIKIVTQMILQMTLMIIEIRIKIRGVSLLKARADRRVEKVKLPKRKEEKMRRVLKR